MKFENYYSEDFEGVKRIHDLSKFPLPNYESPLYAVKKVIRDQNGTIIGSYFLHLTAEIGLILDDKINDFTKAKIISKLDTEIWNDCHHLGLEDAHVFVVPKEDKEYTELLQKKLGFVKPNGNHLYRGL